MIEFSTSQSWDSMKPESDSLPLTKKPLREFQILLFTPQLAKPPVPMRKEPVFENNTSGEFVMRIDFCQIFYGSLFFSGTFLAWDERRYGNATVPPANSTTSQPQLAIFPPPPFATGVTNDAFPLENGTVPVPYCGCQLQYG